MTNPGTPPVGFVCPHCQHRLPAPAVSERQAGRQACPHCGRSVKLPGPSSKPASGTPAPATPPEAAPAVAGIANIAVMCPFCGTRMYATPSQIGETMVCPDCLETVAVTGHGSAAQHSPVTKPPATPTPVAPPSPNRGHESSNDEEDLMLSEPVELPARYFVPAEFTELLDRAAHVAGEGTGEAPAEDGPPPRARRVPPDQFAIKCPVCDTLIYATPDEIGTRKPCPDCYSSVEITPPRKKPRKVSDVVDADYEGDSFRLGEPADLSVYRQVRDVTGPAHGVEDVLARAQMEWQRRRQEERDQELGLVAGSLWQKLFIFLADSGVLARVMTVTILLAAPVLAVIFAINQLVEGGGPAMFNAAWGCALTAVLTAIALAITGITCQTILQDTANGDDWVTQWPSSGYLDWITDAFPFAFAVFFALLPGAALTWFTRLLGLPFDVSWLLLGVSVFLFFPLAQLSLLETGTLTNPLSLPILKSVRDEFLLWVAFYLTSFLIVLPVAITISMLTLDAPTLIVLGFALVWTLALFVYFRLLGRLAWICQVRPMQREPGEAASTAAEPADQDTAAPTAPVTPHEPPSQPPPPDQPS